MTHKLTRAQRHAIAARFVIAQSDAMRAAQQLGLHSYTTEVMRAAMHTAVQVANEIDPQPRANR